VIGFSRYGGIFLPVLGKITVGIQVDVLPNAMLILFDVTE
jgi:hypothetical protein